MFLKFLIFLLINYWQNVIVLANLNKEKPNIVIIMADDMGFDDVSFHGGKEFLTPNIDALAYHGKILQRFYTPPVCTPSRATLLTGRYPIHTGSQHLVLTNTDPWGMLVNDTSMATIFQSQGYSTHLIGKWHLGLGRKTYTPTFNGFDSHYGYWGGMIDYFRMRAKKQGKLSAGYDFRRNLDVECVAKDSYATNLFTQEAENIILNKDPQKPLFLIVSHLAPHATNDDQTLQAPQKVIDKFDYIPDIPRRTYAAMVSKLDESVGRIVKALDKTQELKNSILIFYSDNGAPSLGHFNNTGSNWPLRGQKNSPWEGAIRVAAAIWSPLLKNKHSLLQTPIYVGDLLPSLAAAAKIPLNAWNLNLDGLNLWPYILNSKPSSSTHKNREILHMLDDITSVNSLLQGQFKYIKGSTLQGLYDYVLLNRSLNITDPREHNYIETIKNSLVHQALDKFNERPLSPDKIQSLRFQAQVKCGEMVTSCNPLQEECSFDIFQDPCEQNNLAKVPRYQMKLKELRQRVKELALTAIKPRYGGSIEKYEPGWHKCIYTNFLEEPPTKDFMACDYNSPPCQE